MPSSFDHINYDPILNLHAATLKLIFQGADVNQNDHVHKYSALHFAGLSGSEEVCRILLAAGANTNVENTVKRTPSQMAAFVGRKNTYERVCVCESFTSNIPKKLRVRGGDPCKV